MAKFFNSNTSSASLTIACPYTIYVESSEERLVRAMDERIDSATKLANLTAAGKNVDSTPLDARGVSFEVCAE